MTKFIVSASISNFADAAGKTLPYEQHVDVSCG